MPGGVTQLGYRAQLSPTIEGYPSGGLMHIPKISLSVFLLAATAFAADSTPWKVAPLPPASWQRDRVADLTARRKAVLDQIGDHAILTLFAAEPRNYANDV